MSDIELNKHYLYFSSSSQETLRANNGESVQIPSGTYKIIVNSLLSLLKITKTSDIVFSSLSSSASYLLSDVELIYLSGGSTSGGKSAQKVGTVSKGDSFPTTRSDGSDLVAGDWVVPNADDLPFTIDDIEFTKSTDTAVWLGSKWSLNTSPYQKTNEISVKTPLLESICGCSQLQSEINIENVESYLESIHKWIDYRSYKAGKLVFYSGAIWQSTTDFNSGNIPCNNSVYWVRVSPFKYIFIQPSESDIWTIDHYLGDSFLLVQCIINGNLVSLLDVTFPSSSQTQIKFAQPVKGTAILF